MQIAALRRLDAPLQTRDLPVMTVNHYEDMTAALNDQTDAAIWSRIIPSPVLAWINSLPADQLPSARIVLSPEHVSHAMGEIFEAHSLAPCAALDWLKADVETLAREVSQAAKTPMVRLRLDPIFNDACVKMHIDNVFARLICTYRGPGTELGLDAGDGPTLASVSPGMPIYMKGKLWVDHDLVGLTHRSPPILGTGLVRWLVVLEGCRKEDIYPAYDQIYEVPARIR